MKIAHIALWTRDLEGAARFWARWFEGAVGPRYESLRRPGFASRFVTLPEAGGTIELMSGPWLGERSSEEMPGWAHLAIAVGRRERVDAMAAAFAEEGLLVSPPRLTGDGYYEAVVQSPDGVPIELVADPTTD